jgi:hypothetical protein
MQPLRGRRPAATQLRRAAVWAAAGSRGSAATACWSWCVVCVVCVVCGVCGVRGVCCVVCARVQQAAGSVSSSSTNHSTTAPAATAARRQRRATCRAPHPGPRVRACVHARRTLRATHGAAARHAPPEVVDGGRLGAVWQGQHVHLDARSALGQGGALGGHLRGARVACVCVLRARGGVLCVLHVWCVCVGGGGAGAGCARHSASGAPRRPPPPPPPPKQRPSATRSAQHPPPPQPATLYSKMRGCCSSSCGSAPGSTPRAAR